jgi:hypothetical protein
MGYQLVFAAAELLERPKQSAARLAERAASMSAGSYRCVHMGVIRGIANANGQISRAQLNVLVPDECLSPRQSPAKMWTWKDPNSAEPAR